ncbi:auxin-responsive protein SAUR64-like [Zingiber officinale]|uniref:auxin-responsive protein SAUR64-like n=1 Tax=Zingiber officinale TaxID=94328 RepID=UPI001C4BC2F9|nr:auxin-responsive protein SAUR64-like [Zingiber officinale]
MIPSTSRALATFRKLEEKKTSLFNQLAMLSPKRLVEKAKKRLPMALMRANSNSNSYEGTAVVAEKGHFVVYTVDGTRFMLPLAFLNSKIVQELLKLSEEEFGLLGDGPIRLACSRAFMEYIISLLYRRVSTDVEKALLSSIDANRCSASLLSHLGKDQHHLVALT